MQTCDRCQGAAPAGRRFDAASIASWVSWLLLVTIVIVAARIWLGSCWPLWSVGFVAVLSARRELTRLYLRPLPWTLREAIAERPAEAAGPLRELARRQGVAAPTVLFWPQEQMPPHTLAAYYLVHGTPIFLLQRRLQEQLSKEEVLAVFAHELAHHLLGHVKRSALATILADVAAVAPAVAVAVACAGAWDLPEANRDRSVLARQGAAILVVWTAARLCLQVALNAYSRRQELQADRKALAMTGDAAAFVAATRRLAEWAGAVADPPRWAHILFSDSPSLRQRLAVAEKKD